MSSNWYPTSRIVAQLLLGCACNIRILHRERSAQPGRWILASNHISHFDPPLLSVASRRQVDWMAITELFTNPYAATWLRAVNAFPVDRARADREAVRTAMDRLRQNRVVGMFPEGGIRDGATSALGGASLRTGIGALAQLGGAPVLPCVILGSDRLYRTRQWMPVRQTAIWIAFGEPLQVEGKSREARMELETTLAATLRSLAEELRSEFHLTDDDFPKPPRLRRTGR